MPEVFQSGKLYKNLVDLIADNDYLCLLKPEEIEKCVWTWTDDAGELLSTMDDEFFSWIQQRYVDILFDEVPLLSQEDFETIVQRTLERLQLQIPSEALLTKEIEQFFRAGTIEMQSLWRILYEQSFYYAAFTIMGLPLDSIRRTVTAVISAICDPIWRHDIFSL